MMKGEGVGGVRERGGGGGLVPAAAAAAVCVIYFEFAPGSAHCKLPLT